MVVTSRLGTGNFRTFFYGVVTQIDHWLVTQVDRLLVTQVDRFPDGDSEPVLTLLCIVFHEKDPPGRRPHIRLCIRRHLQLDFKIKII